MSSTEIVTYTDLQDVAIPGTYIVLVHFHWQRRELFYRIKDAAWRDPDTRVDRASWTLYIGKEIRVIFLCEAEIEKVYGLEIAGFFTQSYDQKIHDLLQSRMKGLRNDYSG